MFDTFVCHNIWFFNSHAVLRCGKLYTVAKLHFHSWHLLINRNAGMSHRAVLSYTRDSACSPTFYCNSPKRNAFTAGELCWAQDSSTITHLEGLHRVAFDLYRLYRRQAAAQLIGKGNWVTIKLQSSKVMFEPMLFMTDGVISACFCSKTMARFCKKDILKSKFCQGPTHTLNSNTM